MTNRFRNVKNVLRIARFAKLFRFDGTAPCLAAVVPSAFPLRGANQPRESSASDARVEELADDRAERRFLVLEEVRLRSTACSESVVLMSDELDEEIMLSVAVMAAACLRRKDPFLEADGVVMVDAGESDGLLR